MKKIICGILLMGSFSSQAALPYEAQMKILRAAETMNDIGQIFTAKSDLAIVGYICKQIGILETAKSALDPKEEVFILEDVEKALSNSKVQKQNKELCTPQE